MATNINKTPIKRTPSTSSVEVRKLSNSIDKIEVNTRKAKFTQLKFLIFAIIFTILIIVTTIIEHDYSKATLIELIDNNILTMSKNILEFYLMKLNETFTYTIIIPLSLFLTLSISYLEVTKKIVLFFPKTISIILNCLKKLINKMISVIMKKRR